MLLMADRFEDINFLKYFAEKMESPEFKQLKENLRKQLHDHPDFIPFEMDATQVMYYACAKGTDDSVQVDMQFLQETTGKLASHEFKDVEVPQIKF